MLGLNVRVDVYARSQSPDDAVGGSVRADLLRYSNVRARIANVSNPTVLSMQGFEGKDLHNIILYGDHYPAIEREDIVVPLSGRWTGARFKVVEVRFSSVITGGQRAHVQLVAERLRYAHGNVEEAAAGPVAYVPPCTLNGAITDTGTSALYTSTGDPITKFDVIQIDSELIVVASVTPATNLLTLGRGYGGTTAASHLTGAAILKAGTI